MRNELAEILYQRYPAIFSEHIRLQGEKASWKIWCQDGWFDLIDTLCSQLQYWTDTHNAPPYQVTAVKEKFGELRFVARYKSPEQIGAVKMAYAMSTRICEACGASGRHVVAHGIWMTRCELHMPDGAVAVDEYKKLLEARQAGQSNADTKSNSQCPDFN